MDSNRAPGIELGQIVVERALFEHRADYLALDPTTKIPSLPLSIKVELGLGPDARQGLVRLSLETDRSQNPLYAIDASLVAVVKVIEGQENMPLERFAAVSGGALLMPFMRELVANLTSRGRFGPVWLHPVNLTTMPFQKTDSPAPTVAGAATEPRRKMKRRPRRPRPRR